MATTAHHSEFTQRRVLIYGTDPQSATSGMLCGDGAGRVPVGFICDAPQRIARTVNDCDGALGTWAELEKIVEHHKVSEIIIADLRLTRERLATILRDCERLNVTVSFIVGSLKLHHGWFRYHTGQNVARTRRGPTAISGSVAKRGLDVILSAALLALLLPVFAAVAVLLKLDSPGPVFFRHERVGKNGSTFRIWKFRSMKVDSPKYARSPRTDSDPRLTRVGRVLRRYSIDELPQILNVLAGDMSLVGPRPEMPFLVQAYGHIERKRLSVKPGITGLWQISPARAMPIHENIEYDLFYIEHQNFMLDCVILLGTITSVIRGIGAV